MTVRVSLRAPIVQPRESAARTTGNESNDGAIENPCQVR